MIKYLHKSNFHCKENPNKIVLCAGKSSTVESLLTDTPNKGHCIKYLSTMDKTKSPNFNPPSNLLTEDSLYTVDKPLEFILVPKCPLFGDSTVIGKG